MHSGNFAAAGLMPIHSLPVRKACFRTLRAGVTVSLLLNSITGTLVHRALFSDDRLCSTSSVSSDSRTADHAFAYKITTGPLFYLAAMWKKSHANFMLDMVHGILSKSRLADILLTNFASSCLVAVSLIAIIMNADGQATLHGLGATLNRLGSTWTLGAAEALCT